MLLQIDKHTDKKPPRLSASKLKVYESCPKRYKLQYLIGQRGEANLWGIIGSAAHKAIELYYRDQTPIGVTLQERVNKHLTPDTEGFEYYHATYQAIYASLQSFDPTLYKPVEMEKYFRLPYPNVDNPICTLEGYIDVIGDTYIVDYKTGGDTPSKKSLSDDLQFIIYYWAYNQLYGAYPKEIIYHRLRNHKQIRQSKFNLEKLDTIIHKFLTDTFEYDMNACENCPSYCGVRSYAPR